MIQRTKTIKSKKPFLTRISENNGIFNQESQTTNTQIFKESNKSDRRTNYNDYSFIGEGTFITDFNK